MALDVAMLLFPPQYLTWGVTATLTSVTNPALGPVEIVVIDHTAGVQVTTPTSADRQDTFITSLVPAAFCRVSDLIAAGLGSDVPAVRASLRRAELELHGKAWRIEASEPRPTPSGEADGELLLYLIEI